MNPGTGSREAMEYLVEEVAPFEPAVKIDGKTFVRDRAGNVELPPPEPTGSPVVMGTLSGLRDFIAANVDGLDMAKHYLTVRLPNVVTLDSQRDGRHLLRQVIAQAKADIPRFEFEEFLTLERFNIALQAMFQHDQDDERLDLLKACSRIKSGTDLVQEDDGVGQSVAIKAGIETSILNQLPNPVRLTPWRAFAEVKQVTSTFILRASGGGDQGVRLALFEADGGYWRGEARGLVRRHLEELLQSVDETKRPHLIS